MSPHSSGLSRVAAAVFVSLLAVHDADAQSLALAPAEVIQTFTPGQPFKVEFSVSNAGSQPVAIRSSVTDLWYNEKNEKTFGPAGSSPHSGANWIQFVPRVITVDAKSSSKLTAFITPPPVAQGGYYAVVFVESKPELAQPPTAGAQPVYANIRLGALILLNAAGTDHYNVQLSNVSLTPPNASENLQLVFTLTNDSNTHIFPKATLAILDHDKRLVAKAEADEKRFLPGQADSMKLAWSGTLPAGDYEGVLTVVYAGAQVQTRSLPFTVRE
jgi:hypothetical protein